MIFLIEDITHAEPGISIQLQLLLFCIYQEIRGLSLRLPLRNFNCIFCLFAFRLASLLWRWGGLKFNRWVAAAGFPVLGAWVRKELLAELTTEIKTRHIVIKPWGKTFGTAAI